MVFTDISEALTLSGAVTRRAKFVQEEDLGIRSQVTMVCHNGKIVWLDQSSKFSKSTLEPWGGESQAQFVSLGGRTILPAFVESHTHLIFAGSRAHEFEWRIQGQTYQEISAKGGGIRFTVDQTRNATPLELQTLAQQRANVFLKQGVGTLEVKSGYGLDLATELRCLEVARRLIGPRIVTTYLGAHSRSPDFPDLESYLDHICSEILPRIAREKLAERVDIYIEKGFFTPAQAMKYFTTAKDLGLRITAHVEQLSEFGGTQAALHFQPDSVDHVVFVSDATIQQMATVDTTAVLLPASDLYLKMQYPRARTMLDVGVRVALSTDYNPGTSPTQELSLVGVLARLEMKMTLPEVITAYTLSAAYALGKSSQVGSLTIGKNCDFSVLTGPWNELFYSIGHHPIAAVYVGGDHVGPLVQ